MLVYMNYRVHCFYVMFLSFISFCCCYIQLVSTECPGGVEMVLVLFHFVQ